MNKKAPLLEGIGITKSFGDLVANRAIDFTIHAGEIHAIVGENGAGKSTFIKLIYGLLQPDSGQLKWQGARVDISNPQQARELGIGMVFQHFSLFEALRVEENIALAIPRAFARRDLAQLIAEKSLEYGIPLNPAHMVADLSVGQRQRVEIVRCLLQEPRLLIMDEPTSVLTPQETEQLFGVLRKLAKQGCAVLFISHKLDEVKQLTRRATILRGGVKVAEVETAKKSTSQLAELMIGAKVQGIKTTAPRKKQKCLFAVRGLNRPASGAFAVALKHVSLEVHSGEILGIAGIAGNGQDELMEALSGEWLGRDKGVLFRGADDISRLGIAGRRRLGLAFVPEERNGHGAVPSMRLSENALLTSYARPGLVRRGVIQGAQMRGLARQIAADYDVRVPEEDAFASALSGGNLQKFVVGRELIKSPQVLVVAQPTWGVDVGAAQVIRAAMVALARQGSAVIMMSQDMGEIFEIAHSIAVLNDGALSPIADARKMTAEKIGLLMGGAREVQGGQGGRGRDAFS